MLLCSKERDNIEECRNKEFIIYISNKNITFAK